MSTHPEGKGTKTIGINMKKEIADELERRAASMQLSTGPTARSFWVSGLIRERSFN